MGKYTGIPGEYNYSQRKWAEDAKEAAEAKGYQATISGSEGYWQLKVTEAGATPLASPDTKYGVSILCASKKRAGQMAELVKADGYGAKIERNTGASKKEYPYLVRRTKSPLASRRAPAKKMPVLRR